MKNLIAIAGGTAPLLAANPAWAQNGPMMNGGMWGGGWMGYGGIWGLVLLVVVVAGVVAWLVKRK